MPHLVIQYSSNLTETIDMQALCNQLRLAMIDTGIFPEGGIRVRTFSTDHCSIADAHPDNAFADMVLRIGAGRTMDEKSNAGEAIMAAAKHHFRGLLDAPHFALSLEIIEIDKALSWKANSIHPRLNKNISE